LEGKIMPPSQRPVFREYALQHYLQKREKDILPHFVSPPVFICIWILFCLIVVGGFFAATQKLPIQVTGLGIMLAPGQKGASSTGGTVLLFLSPSNAGKVHVGQRSQLQIGQAGPSYSSTIAQVEPGLFSPNDIYKRYGLNCSTMPIITEPSVVVHIRLASLVSSHLYAGSLVTAQVQIGTQSIFSLAGLNYLIGGFSV
jgi:hypothetical protein